MGKYRRKASQKRSSSVATDAASSDDDGTANGSSSSYGTETVNFKIGIPMRDRRFPDSFWVQPQQPSCNVHTTLPLSARGNLLETRTTAIRIPTPPDTNLLFSLFKILEHRHQYNSYSVGSNPIAVTATAAKTTASKMPATSSSSLHRCGIDRHTKRNASSASAKRRRRDRHQQRKRRPERVTPIHSAVVQEPAAGLPDVVADAQHAFVETTATATTMTASHMHNGDIAGSIDPQHHQHRNQFGVLVRHGRCDDHDDVNDDDGNDDDDDDVDDDRRHRHLSAEDPYLTGRRRSLLMLIGDRTGTRNASASHHAASAASATSGVAVASVGASCYSDLLSDLVVNL